MKAIIYQKKQIRKAECPKTMRNLVLDEGILWKVDFFPGCVKEKLYRIVVPDELVNKVLNYYHCALAGGHQGVIKTYCRIKESFYWPGMQKDVYEFVTLCDTCQRTKRDKPPKQANLKTIAPTRRFELVAMDILKLNKTHRGNTYLLVITDMFSKFTRAVPLPDMTTEAVAKAFDDY